MTNRNTKLNDNWKIRESFLKALQASPRSLLQQQAHLQFVRCLRVPGRCFTPLAATDSFGEDITARMKEQERSSFLDSPPDPERLFSPALVSSCFHHEQVSCCQSATLQWALLPILCFFPPLRKIKVLVSLLLF